MNDLLKKGFYLGLGAGAMLKESIERAAEEMSKRGENAEQESRRIGQDMLKEISKQLDMLQTKGSEAFEKQVVDAGLVNREEFEKLAKRLTKLEKAVKQLKDKPNP